MSRLAAPWLCLFVIAGCTRAQGPAPATAVKAWLACRDDAHAAYSLLSRSVRSHITEQEFAARWRANDSERRAQAAALGPLPGRPPTEQARAAWLDGRAAELVHDPEGWRLSSPRVSPAGAGSPEEAVRQLTEALARHDLDSLLDLMSDPLRSLVERELADRLSRLKSSSQKEIQVDGERARLRLDERYYLELRREGGRWRIADFN
jgi:hypothetical protein